MEIYTVKGLTFTYPNEMIPALDNISFSVKYGEFITICGKSGCGKSTLLRQLKPSLSPFGEKSGEILFKGIKSIDKRTETQEIGFVLQSPDNQIVTDKVWHELAFGLESLGYDNNEICARVAEMASFFGIQEWFHKSTAELSGGQKQLLNLASVMVMQPSVLILDEPTSQLDPIAAQNFLEILSKINREIGTTVILTEHRLEEAFPLSDRIIVMDSGKITADSSPDKIVDILKNEDIFLAMPTPVRVYGSVKNNLKCPVTVREGRQWLHDMSPKQESVNTDKKRSENEVVIELKDVRFRYERKLPDVIKGLSAKIYKSELYAIVGGNGTGKTTTLSVIAGLLKPYSGCVKINRENAVAALPQNPQALFVKKTVELDLYEVFSGKKTPENKSLVENAAELCELDKLMQRHPYDLSGGEQQRAALAKVLLLRPDILLLDEPTKGLDAFFKEKLAEILFNLRQSGITIVMVSHDIEFCARYADRCAMFFDGNIVCEDTPRKFFTGKSFYTTAANRMARGIIPDVILDNDIIRACGGEVKEKKYVKKRLVKTEKKEPEKTEKPRLTKKRIMSGIIWGLIFIMTVVFFQNRLDGWKKYLFQLISILEAAFCLNSFIVQKSLDCPRRVQHGKRKLSKRTLIAAAMILIAIPLTIYTGIFFLGDRKYYFISLLIMLETALPFVLIFEKRRPEARELIIISVLCAIAVAGRTAFYMLPQFKPVLALVIIAGVCFGGETGFLVGAVTGFISNMFFGQGPWTPWQMFSFGIIGFIAGILFQKGFLRKTRGSLCIFGIIAAFFIYGGIMNPSSVIMWQARPTKEMFISAYLTGIPLDMVHAEATAFFLWFISAPMIEKLDRIKVKFGIVRAEE